MASKQNIPRSKHREKTHNSSRRKNQKMNLEANYKPHGYADYTRANILLVQEQKVGYHEGGAYQNKKDYKVSGEQKY